MFFTSFSISHLFVLACHFLAFVFCLNCCNLPYCHIFSNLVFFTDIFIFHYVTYVCLLRLMPLCKTCFDCIFIPLHLTKWAVAHESLCSIIKIGNFSAQCSVFLILLRKNKLAELKCALTNQQKFIKVFNKESDAATEASFVMSWNIARSKHLYSDSEFVKSI